MFPKLRFKEFDDDWSPYVLKDFVSFRKGKGISKADISENGINECIRYGELYTTYGQVIDHIHSKTNVSKSECILSKAGDVIIPASGETQIDIATASCVLHDDIILSGDLNILSHEENGSWLAYYLSSAKKLEIAQLAQGNSVVHLYSSQLKDLKINKPSKEEQTKIASFLSSVDEKISQLTQKHELLSQYKQGMMQKLFSQQIRFKADDGSEFGEWENTVLGDIADIVGGGTPSTNNQAYWSGDVVWLTPSEINQKFIGESKRTISELGVQKSSAKKLPIGTILFTSRATIGEVAIAIAEVTTNQGFQSFISNEKTFNEFLYYWIVNNKKSFIERASGSTFLEISKSKIQPMEISLPCLEEQTKIANFLSAIDQKIEVVAQQIEQAKQWKKGLLQQMFI